MPDGRYGKDSDCDSLSKPEVEKPCQVAACVSLLNPGNRSGEPLRVSSEEEPYISNLILTEEKNWRVGAWTQVCEPEVFFLLRNGTKIHVTFC